MQRLLYNSERKATKNEAGITKVTLDVDGKLTELGTVQNFTGTGKFEALLVDGTSLGEHNTKKQAGGALKKHHDNGSTTGAVAAPVEVKKEQPPKAELKANNEDKTSSRPSALAKKPDPVLAATANELFDMDMNWGDDDDLLTIPVFLRRVGASLAEEM